MKKLLSCFLVGSLMTVMLLTGCGTSASETASDDLTSGQTSVDGIQYGQILSISDSEIVLALGSLDQKAPGKEDGSQKPTDGALEAPSGDNAPQQSGGGTGDNAPPEGSTPPEGNAPTDGGTPPNGSTSGSAVNGRQGKSMIELTGDKLTIAITDDTVITYMRMGEDTSDTTASLSDLAEGDTIAVTVDEDGTTALEITIMTFGTPGEMPENPDAEAVE